ncbi:MAG: hypothetical protein M1840_001425 [Geoglossum simile]|nr:MAG: hypothetical protein M1840_001425 [Geoglossum simile]
MSSDENLRLRAQIAAIQAQLADRDRIIEEQKRLHEEAEGDQERLREQLREEAGREQKRLREEAERYQKRLREEAEGQQRRREQSELRFEELEKYTRKTTLPEYLGLCHIHLFNTISVETDRAMTTQGEPITKRRGKIRPDHLRPWDDFLDIQMEILDRLFSIYPRDDPARAFEHQAGLETIGNRISNRKLASEPDVQNLQREAVETPVAAILNHLRTLEPIREEFRLFGEIQFHNHLNALGAADEVAQILSKQTLEPSTPPRRSPANFDKFRLKADQVCVYSVPDGDQTQRTLVTIVEYKAPHKLTLPIVRLGFRPMDLEDIIDRQTIPASGTPAHFQYHADKLVAAIATQAFSYMIEGGIHYGYITTAEAFIFLHVPTDEPNTVYYHVVEPQADVDAQSRGFPHDQSFLYRTAVSQVMAFTLLAFESEPSDQDWRTRAKAKLHTWEDCEDVEDEMPRHMRGSPPHSEYRARTWRAGQQPSRSPVVTRSKSKNQCGSLTPILLFKDERDPPDSSGPGNTQGGSTSGRGGRAENNSQGSSSQQKGGQAKGASHTQTSSRHNQHRPFCTQKCLRGLLTRGGLLDQRCPNVSGHRHHDRGSNRHPLDRETVLVLLREQLARTLDEDCRPLGRQGSRGAMFKVTLTSHGYTLVAKGTVLAFAEDLRREYQVYQCLNSIQGFFVPVCLGNVDLVNPYHYDVGVRIVHMMFLSWAGDSLYDGGACGDKPSLAEEVARSIKAIHRAGVLHRDVRTPNLCWNSEVGQVMVIDFERSEILQVDRSLVRSPTGRKRRQSVARTLQHEGPIKGPVVGSDMRFVHEVLAAREAIL